MPIQDDSRCWDATHHSYSRDGDFDACQYRYASFGRKDRVNIIGDAGVVGWAVDAVAMDLIAGRPSDLERKLDDKIKAQQKLARKYQQEAPKYALEPMLEKAIGFLDLFEREVLPEYLGDIYATQLICHWQTPDGQTWHCHIDIVLKDGSIRDLKTSGGGAKSTGKRLTIDRAETDYQLTTYADAIWRTYGHLPPTVGVDQLTWTKPPKEILAERPDATRPWWDRSRSQRTKAQLEAWERDAVRRQRAMDFAAATGTYQTQGRVSLYECKSCPVKPECPAWTGY